MTKKNRSIKVYGQSGYKYKDTPAIMLKGMWLRELGFDIGDYISISCENGKLVITPDAERAELAKAAVPVTIGHLMVAQIEDEELPAPSEYIMNRNGVDFIPSSMVLSAVDAKLRLEMGAERMLANILDPLRDSYDYLVIDTCPALGALTINALVAADGVVITVNPQLLAMMGLQEFLKTIKKIKSRINPKLEVEGILLTMCEARTNLCKVISEQVAETFEGQIRIFESKIPSTVKVGESIYYSEPLLEYAPQTRACKAYLDFGRELIGYESKSA